MRRLIMLSPLLCGLLLACGDGDDPAESSGTNPATDNTAGGTDTTDGTDSADADTSVPDDASTEETSGDAGGDTDGDGTEKADTPPTYKPHWKQDDIDLNEEFVLRGVWGASSSELVCVGNKSTILEFAGGEWTVAHQNTELDNLNGVWGSSMDDVWAVGAHGAILHRDASGWNIGTGCTSDAACDDGDTCTIGKCGPDGQCQFAGSGQAGCCGAPGYSTDWETGTLEGWAVEDTTGGGVLWFVGGSQANSGEYALHFGNQDSDDFQGDGIVGATATSPPLKLPKAASIELKFQVFIDTESGGSYDKLELRVLIADVPTTVWTKEDVGGTTGQTFAIAVADLTEFQGKTVQLQFWFDSVDSIANNGLGVYVDDLKLGSMCGGNESGSQFPTLWDVWGTGKSDVFAVGNDGVIVHYDGNSWKRQAGGEVNDLFALGGDDSVIATGGASGEVVTTFTGGFSIDNASTNATIRAMAIEASGEAVAAGDGGTIVRYKDGGWTPEPSGVASDLHGLWTDGTTTFCVGSNGTSLQSSGSGWGILPTPTSGTLYDVWGWDANDVWAVGDKGVLLHYTAGAWEKVGNLTNLELRGFQGFGPDGPYYGVGGGGTVVENTTGVWGKGSTPTTYVLHDLWGASATDIWAVGNLGTILHFDGAAWTAAESPTDLTLYEVWGRSSTEAYAVGKGGVILRWDGTAWTVLRSNTSAALRSVWGLSSDNVYAVGSKATIMHFNGLYWRQIKVEDEVIGGSAVAVLDNLFDIWGVNSTDLYAIGMNGVVIHTETDQLTGNLTWVKIPQENEVTMRAIWGMAKDEMVMAGREGTILSFDGQTKTAQKTGSIAQLYDVIGFGKGDMIAVGDLSTVLRFVPKP